MSIWDLPEFDRMTAEDDILTFVEVNPDWAAQGWGDLDPDELAEIWFYEIEWLDHEDYLG